ncbi:4712_t:CDS:2, partial [Ambispora gerdemannii]
KGRKNQRAAIHKYITERMSTNGEWQSFIAEAFSMLADERMAEKLQFTKDGKIPDVLLYGTSYYETSDEE